MALMRVAYVHDWLVTYRGGEKVLEALLSLYPEAPVYTLFYDPSAMPPAITSRDIRVPGMTRYLRKGRKLLLPLLPRAVESIDLSSYDLLISTSSCVAKGAVKGPHAKHLCYIHSPMRYAWDQMDEYIAGVAHIPGAAWGIRRMMPYLRRWDQTSARRVDHFVANSTFVQDRVRRYYQRDAVVIHPPIEVERFRPMDKPPRQDSYLLACGALVSYKRFDLAIAAAERLGKKLIIAGAGPMEAQLRQKAGPHTSFEIMPSDARMVTLLAQAEALLFPGVEDFGMIAIEAMAAGTPVIAFQGGGARDFISPKTGVFFKDASVDSLVQAIKNFHPSDFQVNELRAFALNFGRPHFLGRIQDQIETLLRGDTTT
jgi:glycosyltransferase involved in cell wall biosynthesis